MNVSKTSRIEALTHLIQLDEPIQGILETLSTYAWDSKPLVLLTSDMVASILRRFMLGELQHSDIATWAEAIECRDDIEFSGKQKQFLKEIMNELANPELKGQLSPERASNLYKQLS